MLETTLSPQQTILFPPPQNSKRRRQHMSVSADRKTPTEKILSALLEFDYLTAQQLTTLLYATGSLTYVRAKLRALVAAKLVLALSGKSVGLPQLPQVFTPTGKARAYASNFMGNPTRQRFRPSEEQEKADNLFFIKHTLAIRDVLIAARLLANTTPGIVLNRIYQERDLRRKIYVEIPVHTGQGKIRKEKICLEPDASCEFIVQEKWRDFFHIEVYRYLPVETLWKQKVTGLMTYRQTGQHQTLFHTSALSIAVFAQTTAMARTLKAWTEEGLTKLAQPAEGQRFFFNTIDDPTSAEPAEMYPAPIWQQAFGTANTPLLVLKEEEDEK
jgi:Replication-relaxation